MKGFEMSTDHSLCDSSQKKMWREMEGLELETACDSVETRSLQNPKKKKTGARKECESDQQNTEMRLI